MGVAMKIIIERKTGDGGTVSYSIYLRSLRRTVKEYELLNNIHGAFRHIRELKQLAREKYRAKNVEIENRTGETP